MDLAVGQIIGDYEVLGVLGAGGMGKVYRVRSVVSQRIEALKVLLSDLNAHPELAERFLREIRISAALEHPNIASLRAAQKIGNQLLMVMEYVDGSTLGELMTRGTLPLDRSLSYIGQALAALDYAHGRGVIHRDIKPGNIMVTSGGQVKLTDFGIARLATDTKLTKTGVMVGSLHYMSPEQIEGNEPDARSDIYSLGVTFYELATGKRPFDGDSEYQIMAAHLKGAPQAPREINQALPPAINEVILTALARDMGSRFASAKAMHNAVTSIMKGSLAPTEVSRPAPPSPPAVRKSHRAMYMLAGSIATIAILIGAAIELPNFRHAKANDQRPAQQHVLQQEQQNAPVQEVIPPAVAQPVPTAADQPAVSEGGERKPVDAPVRERRAARRIAADKQETSIPRPHSEAAVTDPPQPQDKPVARVEDKDIPALQDRFTLMAARVAAVRTSLQNLKNAQAESGLGLRGDVVASEERLLTHMDEAENSLKGNDSDRARKHLGAAETELSKLEAFLGR
jgi:eukaryotic-like serine/threonine-protein kinase